MSKLTQEKLKENYKLKGEKFLIDLSSEQLLSIQPIEKFTFIKIDMISELYVSSNNLRSIEEIVSYMLSLQILDMSLNLIKSIQNIDLPVLESLNLNTNQLQDVPKLVTPKLKRLDLSNNRIGVFSEQQLPQLDTLNLSGNKLTFLPQMDGMNRLLTLDLSRNNLTSISRLLDKLPYLQNLYVQYNQIPGEYMDELTVVLQSLVSLTKLDLKKNPVCSIESYELKLLKARPSLRVLDNLEISENVIINMEQIDKRQQYDQIVGMAKDNYMQWMSEREQARRDILNTLTKQKEMVNEVFDNKWYESIEEMNNFFDFIQDFERRKLKGQDIDVDLETLQQWRQKIIQSENMRVQTMQMIAMQQQRNRDQAINNQLSTKNMLEKLYDIALNDPDIWRDLKRKQFDDGSRQPSQQKDRTKSVCFSFIFFFKSKSNDSQQDMTGRSRMSRFNK